MTLRNNFSAALVPAAGFVAMLAAGLFAPARALDLDPNVEKAEQARIALIEKVKAPVLAVLAPGGAGGGSGVILTDDGYAITNFHVAAAVGSYFHCGMANGEMYDAVLVGLDRAGDLALIKLLQKPGQNVKFPTCTIGDSDKVKPGDMTLALGNPLLLATDFNPTVTFGMVSGVHRYQKIPHPAGVLLEYCDCIQVDTAINPGNSGGPLFNMQGEWIGINSAGSLGKSDRINSGAAYSISVNMVKNFLGSLHAGLDCDHATLGAEIDPSEAEEGGYGDLLVKRTVPNSDVERRGLSLDDKLISLAGWKMTNYNQYKNKLGILPKGWRVPLTYRRETENHEVLVRLPGRRADVTLLSDDKGTPIDKPGVPGVDEETTPPPMPPPPADKEAFKLYKGKMGYGNYYFNEQERNKLLEAFKKLGDFTGLQGDWTLKATCALGKKTSDAQIAVRAPTKDQKNEQIVADIDMINYSFDPLSTDEKDLKSLTDPVGSGGMLLALYHYRDLLTVGEKAFAGEFTHGGVEPYYPPPPAGSPPDYKKRVMCDVLRTRQAGVAAKWYFARADQDKWYMPQEPTGKLIGFEVAVDRDDDPCEIYLSDYHQVNGGSLPGRMEVRFKDKTFAVLTDVNITMNKAEGAK
jgi:S1-C subfamily serine protease